MSNNANNANNTNNTSNTPPVKFGAGAEHVFKFGGEASNNNTDNTPPVKFGAGAEHVYKFGGEASNNNTDNTAPVKFGASDEHVFKFDGEALLREMGPCPNDEIQKRLADQAGVNRNLRWRLDQAQAREENARAAETTARVAETKARQVFQKLLADYKALDLRFADEQSKNAVMAAQQDEAAADYDRIIRLQEELDRGNETISDLRSQLSKSQNATRDAEKSRDDADKDLESSKKELKALRSTIDRLKGDVEHEKAAAADKQFFLSRAYADRTKAENLLRTTTRARDELEIEKRSAQLQFQDLHNQWVAAQDTISNLEEQLHAIQGIDETNQALQGDIERLQDTIANHERTLIVKDERISHLEAQFQKERQRVLGAADAAAAMAATPGSPIDEPPNPLSSMADSLAAELDAASDDSFEEMEYDDRELSQIMQIVDIPPSLPAPRAKLTMHVSEAGSVAPVDALVPRLSMYAQETANISPVEVAAPRLSMHIQEAANTSPVEVAAPRLSMHTQETADISPVEVLVPRLSTHAQEAGSVEPVDAALPRLSMHTQEAGSVIPVSPVAPQLSTDTQEAASVVPVAGRVPELSMNVQEASSIASIHPVVFTLSTANKKVANFKPTTPSTPRLTIHTQEVASVEPIEPCQSALELPARRPMKDDSQQVFPSTSSVSTQTTSPRPTFRRYVAPNPSKSSVLCPLIAILLALFALSIYTELCAWRSANAVGRTYSYIPSDLRSGAYGNGRYLFGMFPLAMDVGHTLFSEQMCRWASVAIMWVEGWLGAAGGGAMVLY